VVIINRYINIVSYCKIESTIYYYIERKEFFMIYKTSGVCCSEISFEIEDNIIKNVNFKGGCSGNAAGISKLVVGMSIDDVISRLEGIQCGYKSTSCPDQLTKALKEWRK